MVNMNPSAWNPGTEDLLGLICAYIVICRYIHVYMYKSTEYTCIHIETVTDR